MARTGRPPKKPAERKSKLLQMRLTEAELELVKEAAQRDKSTPVVWARDAVLKKAAKRGG